jgi:hypothetical protein
MAETQEEPPRASNGRFAKRTRSGSKKTARTAGRGSGRRDVSSDQSESVEHNPSLRREDSARLALLTLAILCAALGFALSFLWIAALVLMGVLWGVMLAERPQRKGTVNGLVTEMVAAVVDEAKDVGLATTASDSGDANVSSPGEVLKT